MKSAKPIATTVGSVWLRGRERFAMPCRAHQASTRGAPTELNRAFAETIYDQLPEEVRKAWPSTSSKHDWSMDFDAFFEFALKTTLDAVAPESVRYR